MTYQAVITSGDQTKKVSLVSLDDTARARINRAADEFYGAGRSVQIVLNKIVNGAVVASKVL